MSASSVYTNEQPDALALDNRAHLAPALLDMIRLARERDEEIRVLRECTRMSREIVARLPSSRDPSLVYEVHVDAGGDYTCTCPDYGFRRACKHIAILAALRALPARGETTTPTADHSVVPS